MASKRGLAARLAALETFPDPDPALEQYPTPPELAASLVHLADLQGDVGGRTVVDLGCGTGLLAIGAAFRAPSRVVGVDVDPAALAVARENERRVDAAVPIGWVRGDGGRPPLRRVDSTTVVTNPPFGARDGNRGADRRFLEAASRLADVSYSVHNAGSDAFVEAFAADNGGTVTHAFALEFDVDRQFDHHTEARRAIDAEAYRIDW